MREGGGAHSSAPQSAHLFDTSKSYGSCRDVFTWRLSGIADWAKLQRPFINRVHILMSTPNLWKLTTENQVPAARQTITPHEPWRDPQLIFKTKYTQCTEQLPANTDINYLKEWGKQLWTVVVSEQWSHRASLWGWTNSPQCIIQP